MQRQSRGEPPLPEEDLSKLFKPPQPPARMESLLIAGTWGGRERGRENMSWKRVHLKWLNKFQSSTCNFWNLRICQSSLSFRSFQCFTLCLSKQFWDGIISFLKWKDFIAVTFMETEGNVYSLVTPEVLSRGSLAPSPGPSLCTGVRTELGFLTSRSVRLTLT